MRLISGLIDIYVGFYFVKKHREHDSLELPCLGYSDIPFCTIDKHILLLSNPTDFSEHPGRCREVAVSEGSTVFQIL